PLPPPSPQYPAFKAKQIAEVNQIRKFQNLPPLVETTSAAAHEFKKKL
ncbi:hypothetical protein TeGR_g6095, partial [Tetraparma gracilis]